MEEILEERYVYTAGIKSLNGRSTRNEDHLTDCCVSQFSYRTDIVLSNGCTAPDTGGNVSSWVWYLLYLLKDPLVNKDPCQVP